MKKYLIGTGISLTVIILAIAGYILIKGNDESNNKSKKSGYKIIEFSTYDFTEDIDYLNPEGGTAMVELEEPYTPEKLLKEADAVIIGSIISKDEANPDLRNVVGDTYGSLVVNNVLYGDIKRKSVLSYARAGGVMSLAIMNRYAPEEKKEKNRELWKQNGINPNTTYTRDSVVGDIDIEVGKTYLCYLKYLENESTYYIIGFQYGFRELNIPKRDKVTNEELDISEYSILNNETDEYESLKEYINNNISTN